MPGVRNGYARPIPGESPTCETGAANLGEAHPDEDHMLIRMIEGFTRILGKSQGYLGLPLRDEMIDCPVGGSGMPSMVTTWNPHA